MSTDIVVSPHVVYHQDSRSGGGVRFIDVWGVPREELEMLPGISIVVGPTIWNSMTVLAYIMNAKNVIAEIVSRYGAVELETLFQQTYVNSQI